jgi:hypothetical protein
LRQLQKRRRAHGGSRGRSIAHEGGSDRA